MENIKLFENEEFGNVRIIEENGRYWFCGADAAKVLGYSNTRDALARHCRCVVKYDTPHPQSREKKISMQFITESDLYRLIANSTLDKAVKFESWVFDEVLPELRKAAELDESDAFRMLEKQCQRKATDKLKEMNATKVDYCKTYAIANKAVSTLYGFDKSLNKNEMNEDMLLDRIPILNVTADLMLAKDKGLIDSVSEAVYSLFTR